MLYIGMAEKNISFNQLKNTDGCFIFNENAKEDFKKDFEIDLYMNEENTIGMTKGKEDYIKILKWVNGLGKRTDNNNNGKRTDNNNNAFLNIGYIEALEKLRVKTKSGYNLFQTEAGIFICLFKELNYLTFVIAPKQVED